LSLAEEVSKSCLSTLFIAIFILLSFILVFLIYFSMLRPEISVILFDFNECDREFYEFIFFKIVEFVSICIFTNPGSFSFYFFIDEIFKYLFYSNDF
jgi:hypothetical protein